VTAEDMEFNGAVHTKITGLARRARSKQLLGALRYFSYSVLNLCCAVFVALRAGSVRFV